MEKVIGLLSLVLVITLAACGNDNDENSTGNGNLEVNNNSEENLTAENVNHANAEASDNTDGEDVPENEDEESEESNDNDDIVATDAKDILRESAEAMGGLSSYLIEGENIEESTIGGLMSREETSLKMEMVFDDESTTMYMQSSMVSDTDPDEDMEVYMSKDAMYIEDPQEGLWYLMPNSSEAGDEVFNTFMVFESDEVEEFVSQGELFEVTDKGDHYLLSFNGNDEEYKSVVLGSDMIVDVLPEHFENMEIEGTYEMLIDKETFYIVGNNTEYEFSTTGEMGDVETYHKSDYTLSHFNEYDEIIVPEEVIEQAISFGN